jgi:hypothetical protein
LAGVDVTAPGRSPGIPPHCGIVKGSEIMSFKIDTGSTGGSLGPWVTWSSNGSAEKGLPPRSWVLRGKDEMGSKSETAIPAFVNGCVMDLDSLKLGWEKDGAAGMAPERRWNPSISKSTDRPDDSKKKSGAYSWSQALSVRLAIGGGQAATWLTDKVADLPPIKPDIAWVAGKVDLIADAICKRQRESLCSATDLALAVINALMEAGNDDT